MSTPTQVDAALDAVAQITAGSTNQLSQAKVTLLSARNQLANIGAQFADEIATINGYTPTGPHEELAKDLLSKYSADKAALQTTIEAALDFLGVVYS